MILLQIVQHANKQYINVLLAKKSYYKVINAKIHVIQALLQLMVYVKNVQMGVLLVRISKISVPAVMIRSALKYS